MKTTTRLAAGLLALAAVAGQGHADPLVDRMRDQLRQTITQLRQLEDENLSLKAKLASASAAPAVKTVVKDNSAELNQLRSAVRQQSARADDGQQRLVALTAQLEQVQLALQQANSALNSQQAAASGLNQQAQTALAKQQLCESYNQQLSVVSGEILARFQQQGFWQALAAHEPVTALYRVRIDNLAQDYQNRIADASVAPVRAPEPNQNMTDNNANQELQKQDRK